MVPVRSVVCPRQRCGQKFKRCRSIQRLGTKNEFTWKNNWSMWWKKWEKHWKHWGRRTLFVMEEVVKEPGEMSDGMDKREPLREREFTGRGQLAKYWRTQSGGRQESVSAQKLLPERMVQRLKRAFSQLDKNRNGFVSIAELKAHKAWLEKLVANRGNAWRDEDVWSLHDDVLQLSV